VEKHDFITMFCRKTAPAEVLTAHELLFVLKQFAIFVTGEL
jgi:hypothetical protein